MYRISRSANGSPRLESDQVLGEPDFRAIARDLGASPAKVRKAGLVAAQKCGKDERVETRWNGVETNNVAKPGDWVVMNLDKMGKPLRDKDGYYNVYVIQADRFPSLYELCDVETEFGKAWRSLGLVEAVEIAGGFDIVAPWNEKQQSRGGFLLWNGKEVYGNDAETFAATYEPA